MSPTHQDLSNDITFSHIKSRVPACPFKWSAQSYKTITCPMIWGPSGPMGRAPFAGVAPYLEQGVIFYQGLRGFILFLKD